MVDVYSLANALKKCELTEAVSQMFLAGTTPLYVVTASLFTDSIEVTVTKHKGAMLKLGAYLSEVAEGNLSAEAQTEGGVILKNPQGGAPVAIAVQLERLHIEGKKITISSRKTDSLNTGMPIHVSKTRFDLGKFIGPL